MRKKIFCMLVLSTVVLAGIVSSSAIAKGEIEKKELKTNLLDGCSISVSGGLSVHVHVSTSDGKQHNISCLFTVFKDTGNSWEIRKIDEINDIVDVNKDLNIKYKGYYFKGFNNNIPLIGLVGVIIWIDDNPIGSEYTGHYFFILTFGFW